MRELLRWGLMVAVPLVAAGVESRGAEVGTSKSFKGPTGLQLYSLRDMMKMQGPAVTLDKTKAYGFKYVEVADLGGLSPAEFGTQLEQRGLVPIGKHYPFEKKYYFIEDESPTVVEQIPQSLRFLESLAW